MDAPHAEIESRVLSCIKPQFRAPVSSFAPRPCHICTGTGLTPATSASGPGSPLPHLHRDWANPCHICTGTGRTLPHLHRDWANPCHICTGTRRPGTCTRTPPPLVPVLHTVLRLQIACCLASATSESRRIFLEVRLNVAWMFQGELGASLRAGSCAGGQQLKRHQIRHTHTQCVYACVFTAWLFPRPRISQPSGLCSLLRIGRL